MTDFSSPHGEKLRALLENEKLPNGDRPKVEQALQRYDSWLTSLKANISAPVSDLVKLLDEYRYFLDIEIIFDSEDDFLYRQKGQLKLDNSVLEEFLPYLVSREIDSSGNLEIGPSTCFSSAYFNTTLSGQDHLKGFSIKTKNQDFAICSRVYLRVSHSHDFTEGVDRVTRIGLVVAECKTNLDKTMFQEACATAHDVKCAVTGAKYFLLCEWLDMTPTSTAPTDIDEVLILRKAKRLNSNVRATFASAEGRRAGREDYIQHLKKHPFDTSVFERLLGHIKRHRDNQDLGEDDVLQTGYF